ncbi:MAG: sugar isomerase [Microbacteriaceae bacterium]|jgi:D-arabinose 5-phosphate isomerase GutQ|nr:sugar isomerase [Microbacteriaceae bacterium]HEV7956253.1 SIS domain-containing protein [Marisediminicola sp.]
MTNHTSSSQDEARQLIVAESAAIAAIAAQIDDSFDEAVEKLLAVPGKVIVIGSGTSGAIARRLAHLLSVCGTPSFFLIAADGLHGTVGAVGAGDLVIAISKGGESAELTEFVQLAKDRGAGSIALTARVESPLGLVVDLPVLIDSSTADPGGVIAMGSTLATAAWGDALAIALMKRRGYSWRSVLHSHPGGSVGAHADELLSNVDKHPHAG